MALTANDIPEDVIVVGLANRVAMGIHKGTQNGVVTLTHCVFVDHMEDLIGHAPDPRETIKGYYSGSYLGSQEVRLPLEGVQFVTVPPKPLVRLYRNVKRNDPGKPRQ